MITLLKEADEAYIPAMGLDDGVWIRVIDPEPSEQDRLKDEFGLDPDFLSDVLDMDELARIEKEDGGFNAIIRIPVFDPEKEFSYYTVPYGIISRAGYLMTICMVDNPVSQDILHRRIRELKLMSGNNFILNITLRASLYYLRFLKEISRKTSSIEQDLHKAVKNTDLTELLRYQKSLLYFNTSLRSNELLLEKIHKLSAWRLSEDEQETFEDARIELKQALEMANIYTNILNGMVDTFSSVISNNLNAVMKRLTVVNLALMIPTLFASIYGMNVDLPFQKEAWTFYGILALAMGSLFLVLWIFRKKSMY